MKHLPHIIIFVLCTFCASLVVGQTRFQYIDAAEEAFDQKDYYAALKYYKTALEFDDRQIDINYKAGEAARLFQAYKQAKEFYRMVIRNDRQNDYPLATYWYANMNQQLGDYEEASKYYGIYLSESDGSNAYFSEAAKRGIKSSKWIEGKKDKANANAIIMRLGPEVNTSFSEFAPVKVGDQLIFSSLRETFSDEYPSKLYNRLFKLNDGTASPLAYKLENERMHVAHYALNEAKDKVCFTICEYLDGEEIRCDLYESSIADGNLSEGQPLTQLNNASFTQTQPVYGLAPNGQDEALYFVSDRTGGRGKLDIYYVLLDSNGSPVGDVMNHYDINTSDDDITPYYDRTQDILYFSSRGYEGFGGHDIYRWRSSSNGRIVENIGYPINDSYDDIYFSFDSAHEKAYFSSNRTTSLYLDDTEEACCFDIYDVDLINTDLALKINVFDKLTGDGLKGATVILYENGVELNRLENADDNIFNFELKKDRRYVLVAQKPGFENDTLEIDTYAADIGDLEKNMYLQPKHVELQLFMFDADTKEPLTATSLSFKRNTNPNEEDVVQLNEVTAMYSRMVNQDEILQVEISKDGYDSQIITLNANDFKGQGVIRKDVYLKSGDWFTLLPVILYFDNDRPHAKSWSPKSNVNYSTSVTSYLAQEDYIKNRYTQNLAGEGKQVAEQDIASFFKNEVAKGARDLDRFCRLVLKSLKNGETVEVELRGQASPRAGTAYNKRLTQRRVDAVLKSLKESSKDIEQYISSGKLVLKLNPIGEKDAPFSVSDDYKDERNSIYSTGAARERKVIIRKLN